VSACMTARMHAMYDNMYVCMCISVHHIIIICVCTQVPDIIIIEQPGGTVARQAFKTQPTLVLRYICTYIYHMVSYIYIYIYI
jgi:hypothetical protein